MILVDRLTYAALALALCSGCSGGGSSLPSQINVSGNYAGTVNDSQNGSGALALTISESGTVLSGSLNATSSASGAATASGSLAGTISGTTITATVSPNSQTTGCPLNVTASTTSDGKTISGSYAATNCTAADTGTFTVSR